MSVEIEAPVIRESRRPRQANVTGYGVVKAVTSGDTLILMGAADKGKIPPIKEVCLSGILAPKLGRGKSSTDEAYAWYAKEFLRKKCVGQQVFFQHQFFYRGWRPQLR